MTDYRSLIRLGDVRRWHTVIMAREQTVADHSFRVTVIAMELAHQLGVTLTPTDVMLILFHDAGEDRFGDIPTTAKRSMASSLADALSKMQWKVVENIPSYMTFGYNQFSCVKAERIAKLADLMEAAIFTKENTVSNQGTSSQVYGYIMARLQQYASKEEVDVCYLIMNTYLSGVNYP